MGNMSGSYGEHYTLWASITENSVNNDNNSSNVTVKMFLAFDGSSYYAYTNNTTYGNIIIDGVNHDFSIPSINFSSGQAKDLLLAEWTGDITHGEDGKKSLSVSGYWNTDTTRIGSGSCNASVWLTDIPRYAKFLIFEVIAKTMNSITIHWNCDTPVDDCQYSLNGGPFNGTEISHPTYTIENLTPNTEYSIKLSARRRGTGLWTDSWVIYATTHDIAKISSASNFVHGDNASIDITNPASIGSLSLDLKIDGQQILNRTVYTGHNTIAFSDTELDNLYKKYGMQSSLTATFILSGGGYTHSRTCTVTLTGNQKTVKINSNNIYRRAKVFLNVNGTYKKAVVWINMNGIWRRCI